MKNRRQVTEQPGNPRELARNVYALVSPNEMMGERLQNLLA